VAAPYGRTVLTADTALAILRERPLGTEPDGSAATRALPSLGWAVGHVSGV
jgi:hypothetical protein